MNTEWFKLRCYNGDVKNAFEELVCQLARAEKIKNKSKFIRVAAPDGGVEAYCVLSDFTEFGWQTKFFTSMGNPQWVQIDRSFNTALKKHPNLKKYFICTPLDRNDPRDEKQKWFLDKWNDKVKEWQSIAISQGREIEFEYWGNSEIFERLSNRENEGKLHYWFGKEEFSESWFDQRLKESIRNLDKRYTPELNFELPIAKIFEGLSRDAYFQEQFITHLDELLRNYNKSVSHVREPKVKDFIEQIQSVITEFKEICAQIDFIEITLIEINKLTIILEEANKVIDNLIHQFYELDSSAKKESKEKNNYASYGNTFGWDIEYFRKFSRSIYEFITFLNGPTVILSNNPVMVLTGEAGVGKSHLLADIAIKRLNRSQFTILLLGQHFTSEEPWSQIKKLLHLNCERDTFLSALNSKAESVESRILIIIDAINEGEGKKLWNNYISGFITAIRKYPYLGVVFSVRSSYENLLIPKTLQEQNEVVKVVHHGFANFEYEASKFFFENYQITQPSIPLLHPEFSNPLFLKLFCEGLNKKGLHVIPDGYEGISTIIDFYLESINSKISKKHDLPISLYIIQKTVKLIAGEISSSKNTYIKIDEVYSLVSKIADSVGIKDKPQFFQDLISEGLLTQNLYWDKYEKSFEGLYISYERFSDHLVCSHLLDNFLDRKNPKDSFKEGSRLFEIVKDNNHAYYNKGIIEALSIQLPELIKLELFEVAEHARTYDPVISSFIESLIWRKKDTIHDELRTYINEVIVQNQSYHDYFFSTILLITSHPGHYFNSDFLHRHLMCFSMADRDSWWTQFIHHQYPGYPDDISSIRRMIDWAWTDDKRENISDESIRLMCQTMFWFLSSTNRTLRDSVTKAIICLLDERINVLIQLIRTFVKVNDPYILQRVYAIAYGCSLRTTNTATLLELGDCIFDTIFNTKNVVPDILLRDYARGTIEYVSHKGFEFNFDLKQVRPPYSSEWPNSFPTQDDISKYEYDYKKEGFKDYYWSMNSIIDSMKTNYSGQMYGDFGRYTFESAFRDWRDVNPQDLSNLAVKWIVEKYGYDVDKHGEFDRSRKSHNYDRHYVLEERIGKKYQWIAFYDLLARVADNCICYEDSWSRELKQKLYEGPWDPYVRDIDPTMVIKGNLENKFDKFWWFNLSYSNWKIPNKDWIFKTEDLPNPLEIIKVKDPQGTDWLVLEIFPSWHEPADIGTDRWENPNKYLWYQIRSYITTKKEYKKIIKWAQGKNFMGRWMPESRSRYELFSREYYWSPGCETFRKQEYREYHWSEIFDKNSGKFIGNVAITTLDFLWEEQFDASKQSTISYYKPSELLFKLLDCRYSKVEGEFLNTKNETICFDPCANAPTYSCLLVKEGALLQKLKENGLEIFWTVLGEKLITGNHINKDSYDGRLDISGVVHSESDKLIHTPYYVKE